MLGVFTGSMPRSVQRLLDGLRNEPVHDVVMDLLAEALLDDRRGRLARAEPGQARLARVVLRDAIDLGVDRRRSGSRS